MLNIQKTCIVFNILVVYIYSQSFCTAQTNLTNFFQDRISLLVNSTFSEVDSTFSYTINVSIFNGRNIELAYSGYNYDATTFGNVNYTLSGNINGTKLTINLISSGMRWNLFKIQFWANSRSDMIIGSTNIIARIKGTQSIFSVNLPKQFVYFNETNNVFLNMINGLKYNSTSTLYQVTLKQSNVNLTVYNVSIQVPSNSQLEQISFSYLILNIFRAQYALGGGFVLYQPLSAAQYTKVHQQFAPIKYFMLGFDTFRLALNQSLSVNMNIDSDNIMQISSNNIIDKFQLTYITIGVKTADVCSNCNQYFSYNITQCISSCPNNTYQFTGYITGGKSCLTCSSKVNEAINQGQSGCQCASGYQTAGTSCTPITCIMPNTTLVNNTCVCINGTFNISGVCNSCGANQTFNGSVCISNKTPNNSNTTNSTDELITVSIINNFPIITSSGIIIDFNITQSRPRTLNELNQLITLSYDNKRAIPFSTSFTLSKTDPSRLRCFLSYRNQLPLIPFTFTFTIKTQSSNSSLNSSSISYFFDILNTNFYDILRDPKNIIKSFKAN